MNEITLAFFDAAQCATMLLERPEVESHWTRPSVLAEFTVAGLAGHLLRGIMTVETYLDAPVAATTPMNAVAYYQAAGLSSDPESKLNRDIRTRGEEMAAGEPRWSPRRLAPCCIASKIAWLQKIPVAA